MLAALDFSDLIFGDLTVFCFVALYEPLRSQLTDLLRKVWLVLQDLFQTLVAVDPLDQIVHVLLAGSSTARRLPLPQCLVIVHSRSSSRFGASWMTSMGCRG